MNNIKNIIIQIKRENQFFFPIILCSISFLIINLLGIKEISNLAYSSGYLIKEPFRILLYNFVHKDLNHLSSNIVGILIIRYCFIKLKIKNNKLFYYLMSLIIFLQTLILYLIDTFLLIKNDHLLIGFSGIIFGVNSYLMMASYFGSNQFFMNLEGFKRNYYIFRLNFLILSFGFIYSFLPGVSFVGHFCGALSGLIIFHLSQRTMRKIIPNRFNNLIKKINKFH